MEARKKRIMKEVTPEDLDRWAEDQDLREQIEAARRDARLKESIARTLKDHDEVLERLGSDYDKDGVPYWDQQIHD